MKKLKPGKNNKEDRMNFVKYWAEYIRTHPDEDWSRHQKLLINSQMKNARSSPLSAKAYFNLKQKISK